PWIYENLIKTKAISIIDEKISASDIAVSSQQIKEFFLSISDTIKEVLLKAGVDLAGISDKVSGIDLSSETAAELLEQTAVQPILTVVINCITFIVLAIIFIAVLFMLSNLITKTMSKTVLSGVNKFFGAVFGLVKGFIIVVLLVVVLLLVSAVIQNDVFDSMLASSKIIGLLR
ncbi:MAG: CvpA family protein, partial [Clostridia bacterium]|nr:CvpA family protein [Clostridia bacterium]